MSAALAVRPAGTPDLLACVRVGESCLRRRASHPKVAAVPPKPEPARFETSAPAVARRVARSFSTLAVLALCSATALSWDDKTRALDRPHLEHDLLQLAIRDRRAARVHRFRLPVARLRAEVIDLRYSLPLSEALGDADLVVNGGFWGWHKAQRRVIGLLASKGQLLSPLRAALDGGVLLLHAGLASIVSAHKYRERQAVELAVQCRPRLLQAGKIIPDLNAHSRAPRTAVCVRAAGRTLDVYVTEPADVGPSLQELGLWLAADGCEHALNLDGGPSTAAAFRDNGELVRIGAGRELPYALRFSYDAESDP